MIAIHYFATTAERRRASDEAVERVLASARELSAAAEKTPEGKGCAQRLVKAVQARVRQPRIGVLTNAAAQTCDNLSREPTDRVESFGEKLCKAVKAKVGSRSCSAGRKTEAAHDDETFAAKLARITKARAKGIRVGMS